ncbi:hypothetical protein [Pseudomonas sp. H9]|uniref:hypothetical protein n=1 Tax=Pseudomonas sp. H9 TaxID=483968 RepID=UPI0010580C42|nr:hypothetical protein [Pseudomonas sp. H9]TDF86279.1 hypothetical protein E1573_01540 [Pseudomonas sp. H9]
MGAPFSESTGVLATAADYRVVYVQIKPGSPICPEPSPDVAGQFASSLAAAMKSGPIESPVSAKLQTELAVSMKQLFRRTQGVQFHRDGLSDLCIDRFNGFISPQEYVQQKRELREKAFELIKAELQYINGASYDTSPPPSVPSATVGEGEGSAASQ